MLKEQFPINQNVYLKKKMKFVFKMNIRTTTVTARFSLVLVEALSYRNDTGFPSCPSPVQHHARPRPSAAHQLINHK